MQKWLLKHGKRAVDIFSEHLLYIKHVYIQRFNPVTLYEAHWKYIQGAVSKKEKSKSHSLLREKEIQPPYPIVFPTLT